MKHGPDKRFLIFFNKPWVFCLPFLMPTLIIEIFHSKSIKKYPTMSKIMSLRYRKNIIVRHVYLGILVEMAYWGCIYFPKINT